jgi:hypothetical protein
MLGGSTEENIKKLHEYMGDYNRLTSYIPHITVVLVHDLAVQQYQHVCEVAKAENLPMQHHFDTTYNHSHRSAWIPRHHVREYTGKAQHSK